jgi:hypothetical protein
MQLPHYSPISRREVLRIGALGACGLSLPTLLSAAENSRAKADACVVIYLNGGPSHLDMWDMKPNAPAEIRGEFSPISSSLIGVPLCEHLPRLAKHLHRCTLVRSMNHSVNNAHAAAVYAALTGHDRGETGGGAKPTDHPCPGSVLAKLRPVKGDALPYVTLPYMTKEGAGGPLQPGFLAGFLGATYDPFWVLDDPNAPNFRVQNLSLPGEVSADRLTQRSQLLASLDNSLKGQAERSLSAMSNFQHKAFNLLTSNTAQRAFQIDQESSQTRDRYGRNIYGQSLLLGRRLIEAGTRMVTLTWAPDANATWDTHGQNFIKLQNPLLPQFDAACSSLLEDLAASGRLEKTLVAVLGDFGRTPKVNAGGGRDHWNSCYTILLAGGGIKQGFVFGASDRNGSVPTESPVSPGDIVATMYRLLGIDPRHTIYDSLERPHTVVPTGRVAHEILA